MKNKILILTFILGFFSQQNYTLASSLKNACDDLIYYARKGYNSRPIDPAYYSDPLLEEKKPEEAIKESLSSSLYQIKDIIADFTDLFQKGQASLIIGYNEGPNAEIMPGIFVQRGKNWYPIPIHRMADAKYYQVRPIKYRKDGSIELLHILTFFFSDSPLPYLVVLDDYDETTQTGIPKITIQNPAFTTGNNTIDCIRASKGRLGLRVFAKFSNSNDLIVGSSFENPEELREKVLTEKKL